MDADSGIDAIGNAEVSEIQRKLTKGVWTQGGCKSWYLDARGINRTVWPGFTWRYWMRTKTVRAEDYTLTRARRTRVPA